MCNIGRMNVQHSVINFLPKYMPTRASNSTMNKDQIRSSHKEVGGRIGFRVTFPYVVVDILPPLLRLTSE